MSSRASSGLADNPVGARRRTDKRQAILEAAFTVFARRGYAQACVQEIAKEARVAKPTVYSHLNDKETLFRHTLVAAADALAAENLAVVERLRDLAPDGDLRTALTGTADRLLRICSSERGRAMKWLTYSQVGEFPDLIDAVLERTGRRVAAALADRLARLSLAGRLRSCDPEQAAAHFLALLTAPYEARSALGTRPVPATDLHALAETAVDTFLRAYTP